MEKWKPITLEDFKGLYEISSFGRVRSLQQRKKILNPRPRENGYLKINLARINVRKLRAVHRLVALAFIPNPEGKECINHKDNNPANNYVDNLQWVSWKENSDYKVKQNRQAKGEKIHCSKLTKSQILEIRSSSLSRRELAEKFNVTTPNIRSILKKETWKHVV